MLTYLGDFENPGQLSIQEVLGGTDDCVLKIFIISWIFEITKHGNSVEMSAMDFLKEASTKTAYGMLRIYRKCQYPTGNCMGGWWRMENLSRHLWRKTCLTLKLNVHAQNWVLRANARKLL